MGGRVLLLSDEEFARANEIWLIVKDLTLREKNVEEKVVPGLIGVNGLRGQTVLGESGTDVAWEGHQNLVPAPMSLTNEDLIAEVTGRIIGLLGLSGQTVLEVATLHDSEGTGMDV